VEINWTDLVRNEEVLHGVREETNVLPAIQRGKVNTLRTGGVI